MSDGSLEQAIGAVLQDPQQLQKIFALAQSLRSEEHTSELQSRI